MDRGAWWATVHGVAKSQTRLSNFTFSCFFFLFVKTTSNVLAELLSENLFSVIVFALEQKLDKGKYTLPTPFSALGS